MRNAIASWRASAAPAPARRIQVIGPAAGAVACVAVWRAASVSESGCAAAGDVQASAVGSLIIAGTGVLSERV